MIFNMVGGKAIGGSSGGEVNTEGKYAWSKAEGSMYYPEITSTGTLTASGKSYSYFSGAVSGWQRHYVRTPVLDLTGSELTFTHVIGVTAVTYFIGVAATHVATYSELTQSVMLEGGKIYHYSGAVSNGQKSTFVVGDVIKINIKDGVMSVYKNDSPIFEVAYTPKQFAVTATFYYGNQNYGTFECVAGKVTVINYIVSNEEDVYPDDGYADDGYYYVKIGSTYEQYYNAVSAELEG